MSVNRDNLSTLTPVGRLPDPALQAEAFRLWIENGRSTRIVAEQIGCDRRTIQRWAESENWEQRRVEQAQSFLPGARTETGFALKLAAHNASLRLQQIAFHALETGEKPDVKEVQALTLIIDRGGYSPTGSRNPTEGVSGFETPHAAIDALTDDELIKRESHIGVGRISRG